MSHPRCVNEITLSLYSRNPRWAHQRMETPVLSAHLHIYLIFPFDSIEPKPWFWSCWQQCVSSEEGTTSFFRLLTTLKRWNKSSLKLPTLLSFDIWLPHTSVIDSFSLHETSPTPSQGVWAHVIKSRICVQEIVNRKVQFISTSNHLQSYLL